jgi:hypothetical protein
MGATGFISPAKEDMLLMFIGIKNPLPLAGF